MSNKTVLLKIDSPLAMEYYKKKINDIDDDLREMINEEYGSNDSFNDDWELYKTDYQIDFYTVKGQ